MPYYLDGPTLAQSTAVYTNPELTNCAPDGLYSDNSITRYQSGCVLGPAKFCPSCGIPCGKQLGTDSDSGGVFNSIVDLGNDPGDIGAIIITFTPNNYPHGLIAEYNGIVYNEFSSPIYGYISAPTGLPAYMGDEDFDCGITSASFILSDYENNGGGYAPTGTTSYVSILPSQDSLTVNNPGTCIMVIPKVNLNPSSLEIKVTAPCDTSFRLEVSCPTTLFPTYTSQVAPTDELVCEYEDNLIYYNYPVNGNGVTLGLFDWVFIDPYGESVVGDGYYHAPTMLPPAYDWFLVQNGVIIQMGQCAYNAYVITRCADGFTLVADSITGPVSVGQFVSISDALYAGCIWEITSQTFITPTVSIDSITGYTNCNEVCVLYSVDNMTSSTQTGTYTDCNGGTQSFTVDGYTIDYICARVGSISVDGSPAGVVVTLDSCKC